MSGSIPGAKKLTSILVFSLGIVASLRAQDHAVTDSLFAYWCDTLHGRYPRTIALASFFEVDSAFPEEQASRLAREGTMPGLGERQRQVQLAFVWHARGILLGLQARTDDALHAFAQATRIYEQLHDHAGVVLTQCYVADLYLQRGRLTEAVCTMQPAAQEYLLLGDTMAAVDALWTIASALGQQGNLVGATNEYRRALLLLGDRQQYRRCVWLTELAGFQVKAGRADTALLLVRQAQALERGMPSEPIYMLRVTTARALVLHGECVEAVRLLTTLLDSSAAIGDVPLPVLCDMETALGEALLCTGDGEQARQHAVKALDLAEAYDMPVPRIAALRVLGRAYKAIGDVPRALATLERYYVLNDSITNAAATAAAGNAVLTAQFQRQQIADSVAVATDRARTLALSDARLQRERTRRNIFLLAGLGLLVFGIVVLRQRRRTQKALHRSDELLLNILPEEVAEELKAKGHADAKNFDNVTILFTDFKGFTEASEKLSPQELVEELNTCFQAFDHIITARGIEKIKTIGDAYMCAGGLPDPSSSAPVDVVHAALEMQAFMVARKAERDRLGKPAFEMRVGIHTGPVVAGIVGVKKFAYDIWGDTVNTASRMESSGEVGQVNISEATYELVKNEPGLTFIPRGKVQAKGKGEMEMYFVSPA